jgi:hypothetical protein
MSDAYSIIVGNLYVQGVLQATDFDPPAGCISDAAVASDAAIGATKVIHQFPVNYAVDANVAISAASVPVHCCYGAATLVAVDVVPTGSLPSGTYQYFVDVQKGNSSTAFATVLTGVVSVSSVSALRNAQSGLVASSTFLANDVCNVAISVTGASGAQGKGCLVNLIFREAAQ